MEVVDDHRGEERNSSRAGAAGEPLKQEHRNAAAVTRSGLFENNTLAAAAC
jgi:hypothetical protein